MNLIKPVLTEKAVLPIAIAAFLMPIILVEYPVLQFTHGHFAYPIDDTCIHLAIAKNLAFHQVWGVSPDAFVSAASSILYPIILAIVVKIFGAQLIIPFLVNIVIAIILLIVLKKWLVRQSLNPLSQLLILLGVIFLVPLPALAMIGMEHTLQLLFTFLFITRFSEELEKKLSSGERNWQLSWPVYLYGVLMVMTRYEGVPIAAIACLILLIYRKIGQSILLGLLAITPILLFGMYSLSHGNFFFPNSVLLKSGAPPLTFDGLYDYFTSGLFVKLFYSVVGYNSVATQRLLFLLPLAFLLFNKNLRGYAAYKYMLLLLIAAVFIHLSLTGYASYPRYEAYLVGCAVVTVGTLTAKYGKSLFIPASGLKFWVTCLVCLFLALPLALRSSFAFTELHKGFISNYEISYQVGHFLHAHYDRDAIAVEALGGVSYYTDGKKLDVLGLGDIDVARSLKGNYNSVDFLDQLSKKDSIKIGILSEYSTDPRLLQRWRKVATWQIPLDLGGYYVSFYAIDSRIAPDLKRRLIEFEKFLPEGERAIYY